MITWDGAFEILDTDSTEIFNFDNDVRNAKIAIRERMEKEHDMSNGQHVPGKSRVLMMDTEANILAYSGNYCGFAFSTDTKKLYYCNGGSSWTAISPNHGRFEKLDIDDHTNYLKVDGSRALTGDLLGGSKKITNLKDVVDGDADYNFATKEYVDYLKGTASSNIEIYDTTISSFVCTMNTEYSQSIHSGGSGDVFFSKAYFTWYKGGGSTLRAGATILCNGSYRAWSEVPYKAGVFDPYDYHTLTISSLFGGLAQGDYTLKLQIWPPVLSSSFWVTGGKFTTIKFKE